MDDEKTPSEPVRLEVEVLIDDIDSVSEAEQPGSEQPPAPPPCSSEPSPGV